MEVRVVFMWNSQKPGAFKALANLELYFSPGEAVRVNGFKIMEGRNGFFVSVPSIQRLDKATKQPALDESGKQIWDEQFACSDTVYAAIQEKVLQVYNSGTGVEKPALGQKKYTKKTEGAKEESQVFANTKPLSNNKPLVKVVAEDEDSIPF